jgi:hypothetical protein
MKSYLNLAPVACAVSLIRRSFRESRSGSPDDLQDLTGSEGFAQTLDGSIGPAGRCTER